MMADDHTRSTKNDNDENQSCTREEERMMRREGCLQHPGSLLSSPAAKKVNAQQNIIQKKKNAHTHRTRTNTHGGCQRSGSEGRGWGHTPVLSCCCSSVPDLRNHRVLKNRELGEHQCRKQESAAQKHAGEASVCQHEDTRESRSNASWIQVEDLRHV